VRERSSVRAILRIIDSTRRPVLNVSDGLGAAWPSASWEARPSPALRPYVELLWARSIAGSDPASDRRVLPDGRMDLVWLRGEPDVLVAGPQSSYTLRPDRFPLVSIGARFAPGAAPSLLRLPAAEFIDDLVPLASVDPALSRRLVARLEDATSIAQALAALDTELAGRIDDWAALDPAVSAAARFLDAADATVTTVAAELYLSERQLRRRFVERVGYGPKTLQRVLRFQRLKDILEGSDAGLATAAIDAGYADQAHLTRDCRNLAGLTPRELVAWLHRPHKAWDAAPQPTRRSRSQSPETTSAPSA